MIKKKKKLLNFIHLCRFAVIPLEFLFSCLIYAKHIHSFSDSQFVVCVCGAL